MSKLTKCNYCTLQYLKKNLKPGYKLSQIGNDIYVHPENIEYYDMSFNEREKYWKAWLMEIPNHCVCKEKEMTNPKCDTDAECNTITSVHETTINNKNFVLCLNPREINECSFYGTRNGVLGYWKEK